MNPATIVLAKLTLGAGLALGLLAAPHGVAHAAPVGVDVYAYETGDDDADGVIQRTRADGIGAPWGTTVVPTSPPAG